MKHFLLTLLLTFIVGVCSAQTEHMKFKGVPMEQYCVKLIFNRL